ncbi:hypothetical protein DQ04_06551010 [Trypanosoma grayi]|uniref:hypothetical protein n=1 Tax=Trypanosoma grayi TaxID=71804 RepID=UPI0004F42114|nr:hypothetical protein DQ04_06551010 [Trypanosoma grayi]KEG08731.1 hypothetical protein DQ04_06551010 [Trypanosoma grayi]
MTRQSDVQESMNKISSRAEKAVEVRKYDEKAVQQRMQKLHADIQQMKLAEKKKADELAQVHVVEEDILLLERELGCDRTAAEQRLREKRGDLVAVLREVTGLPKAKAVAPQA